MKNIDRLKEQLKKIEIDHPNEEKDTYWRGVMIGLKTAIEILSEKQNYFVRLIAEEEENRGRIERLEEFLSTSKPIKIDPVQVVLLKVQLKAMKTYNECLEARISRIDKE